MNFMFTAGYIILTVVLCVIIFFFTIELKVELAVDDYTFNWDASIFICGLMKLNLNKFLLKIIKPKIKKFIDNSDSFFSKRRIYDKHIFKLLSMYLRALRLKKFRWKTSYCLFGEAVTGELNSIFWTMQLAVYNIIASFIMPVKSLKQEIVVIPNFGVPGLYSDFGCEISFKPVYFFLSLLNKDKNKYTWEDKNMHDEHSIDELIRASVESIRDVVDVNTIIGEPIETADGMTIIPVSKVTVGFGAGGMDLSKSSASGCSDGVIKTPFGGGTGAGITVQPVAFLVAGGGQVKMMTLENNNQFADKFIEFAPQVLEQFQKLFKKKKDHKKTVEDSSCEVNID